MLVYSAVPCIIQYTSSEHHIIIPQTHGLIIARQWALPLSVELLPTATGSYAGVIRSAVGSLNREINVCSTIGPRGMSQTREEPEPCDTRAASLFFLLIFCFLPPDFHLSLFLSSSSSSSAVICFPSLYMYLHPFFFSFLSLLLPFVLFLWIWEQRLTRTRELQLLINDYFQRWQSTARKKRNAEKRKA